MSEQDAVECKLDTSTGSGEMQTVVSSYAASNLIRQTDRLIDVHGYTDASYTEYQYGEEVDRLSPEVQDEKINVDDEDKDEELVIADDDVSERNDSTEQTNDADSVHKDTHNVSDNIEKEDNVELSWHPHVYGKPPKKPTPHTIEYILGLSKEGDSTKEEPKRSTVSQLMNVKRNFDSKKNFSFQEKSTQVQRDLTDRKFNISVHKNKLQEQLLQRGVRTSDSGFESVFAFKSDDQPLNLSVPKSKDSPVWSGADEDKLGKGKLVEIIKQPYT
ncbi:unnamed protein product [Euphydryas editha]|uniref:Uncharacterized protein n=1 Tax=Euphydryas editha TaxID=104508 RepID=A0AAU9U762_EUPED|nr:unnamed protein product [Euphydryas editha]